MKHTFRLMLGIFTFLLVSCSEDQSNETQSFNLKTANQNLKNSYDLMISSQPYIDYDNRINDFFEKMNYDDDPSLLREKSDILNWITNNLSQTNFINYQSAIDEWDQVEFYAGEVENMNYQFWNDLRLSDEGDFADIIFEPYPNPVEPNSCAGNCRKAAEAQKKSANAAYEKHLREAFGPVQKATALIHKLATLAAIELELSDCLDNC